MSCRLLRSRRTNVRDRRTRQCRAIVDRLQLGGRKKNRIEANGEAMEGGERSDVRLTAHRKVAATMRPGSRLPRLVSHAERWLLVPCELTCSQTRRCAGGLRDGDSSQSLKPAGRVRTAAPAVQRASPSASFRVRVCIHGFGILIGCRRPTTAPNSSSVSYTHLTLPTKRIV